VDTGLWTVKTQAYPKAGKIKKSVTLDNFCEGTGYCRRHAAPFPVSSLTAFSPRRDHPDD
jgi:hypothetical protein